MQFAGIPNPFGTNVFEPTLPAGSSTLYYKGMRLHKRPVRIPAAPKPLTETVTNFLLNYDK
jgi:hypothetical protein